MSGSEKSSDDFDLDALFDEARQASPVASSDLMQRISKDAALVQTKEEAVVAPTTSWLKRGFAALGGWPALGGLATAAVTGVYIGFMQPELVNFDANGVELSDFDEAEFFPGDALFFEEG